MDEFNEFSRPVLESLRQPMESGKITVSRSRFSVDFPSKFLLVASSNPCPCGYYGDSKNECRCTHKKIKSYRSKLSGPILDRIDIHINVFPVDRERLLNDKISNNELSKVVKDRVLEARKRQNHRYRGEGIFSNSEMSNSQVDRHCKMRSESKKLLVQATDRFGLSTRAYFKLIKVARTIADLEGKKDIEINHVAEAVQYRSKVFL
jgi:magnesium chelatase family protein